MIMKNRQRTAAAFVEQVILLFMTLDLTIAYLTYLRRKGQ